MKAENYNNASDDYKFWSKDYNMHFGLAIPNFFNRQKMLKKMNSFILRKTGFFKNNNLNLIDIGCGCGGTLRQGCEEVPTNHITGITLSDWQINKCKELTNAKVLKGDYHQLPFEDETFSGGMRPKVSAIVMIEIKYYKK